MSTEVRVAWVGPGLRLVGDVPGGHATVLDHVLPGEDRVEAGIRPMHLLLLGMAGCTAMDVVSILRKKRESVTGLHVTVAAERAEDHPRVYTKIHLEYVAEGEGLDKRALARSVELSVTKYCSAIAMLAETADVTTSYRIEGA
jgi:putative redox protein